MHGGFPENVKTRIWYTYPKHGTKFNNIIDRVKKSHKHDIGEDRLCRSRWKTKWEGDWP